MKKTLFAAFLVAMAGLTASASTTYTIRGLEYEVDTLFHAQIGPGTTHTSLFMRNAAGRQMYVQYAITDLENPYITLSAVMGNDRYAGGETVSSMSKRKSRNGARYFLGVNGDFFRVSGQSSSGESVVGAPIGPCIADNEIYHGNNTSGGWCQFALDTNKVPMFGITTMGGNVTCKGVTMPMGQMNSEYACNEVELFSSSYLSGTSLYGTCAEVQAEMAEGETFGISKPFKLVVTSAVSNAGNLAIPAGGYVIRGQGSTLDFVNNMQVGDTVTFNIEVSMDGKKIVPQTLISSLPFILKDSEILDTEHYMSQFSSEQPLTVMGYDKTQTKIIFAQIDGRSPISSGMRTSEGAELLRYLGASDGFNFDSGGSSTLYTSALGTRNNPSDGTERNDANGFFAVSTAPDDSTVAQIAFVDWVAKVPKYGVYVPKFYGYDKYGMLIDTDVQGVTITAPESVGHVQNDSIFFGDGSGDGLLTAHLGSMTCTVPVQILGSGDGIAIKNDSIVNDGYHAYQVEVQNTVGEVTLPIDASVLTWSSSDESVVKIDAQSGVLTGVANGVAYVYGKVGEFADTLKVTVEIPTARHMSIDPTPDMSTWKISQSGGKSGVATTNGDGFDYTYTGASSRSPKITLSKTLQLWSLPDAIALTLATPDGAPVQSVTLGLRANGESMKYVPVELVQADDGSDDLLGIVETESWTDAGDISKYPITLSTVQLNMGASTAGQQYTINCKRLQTVYYAVPAALTGDVNGDGVVNASDVSALVNHLLEGAAYDKTHDTNGDGVVNAADVSAIVNIILAN